MRLRRHLCLTIFVLAASVSVSAKSFALSHADSGKLTGLILDSGRARVAGAKIIIESQALRMELKSDDNGSYEIELPEGNYQFHVELAGFYPSRKKSVRINSNTLTKLDMILKGIRVDGAHP